MMHSLHRKVEPGELAEDKADMESSSPNLVSSDPQSRVKRVPRGMWADRAAV